MRHSCWLRAMLISSVCVLPMASPAMAKGVFVLQLGSFKTASEAEAHSSKLQQNSALSGLSVQVSEVLLQPDNYKVYRTQAGPLATRPEAQRLCTQVKSAGSECFVVESAMFAAAPATPTIKNAGEKTVAAVTEEPQPVTLSDESPKLSPLPAELPLAAKADPARVSLPEPKPQAERARVEPMPEPVSVARNEPLPKMVSEPVRAETAPVPPTVTPAVERSTVTDKPDSMFSWIFSEEEPSKMETAAATPETPSETSVAKSGPIKESRIVQNDEPNRTPDPASRKRQRFNTPTQAAPARDTTNEPAPTMREEKTANLQPLDEQPLRIESPKPIIERRIERPVEPRAVEATRLPETPMRAEPTEPVAPITREPVMQPLPPAERAQPEIVAREPEPALRPAIEAPAAPRVEAKRDPAYTPPPRSPEPVVEKTADGYIRGREPKALNVGAAPSIAAPYETMEPAPAGKVEVAEAVRVPVSGNRAPVTRVMTAETEAVRYAYPSQELGIRTLWAQLSSFPDEQSALNYWNQFSAANNDIASEVRVRVTRPYMASGRNGGVSLRVGPYGSAEEIIALCGRTANDNVRCSGSGDLGTGGTRGQERLRGVTPRDYTQSDRPLYGIGQAYWLQLGSYASRAEAQSAWEGIQSRQRGLLGKRGSNIVTPASGSHTRPIYRLRTGPFTTSNDASTLCGRLSAKGVECLVVKDR